MQLVQLEACLKACQQHAAQQKQQQKQQKRQAEQHKQQRAAEELREELLDAEQQCVGLDSHEQKLEEAEVAVYAREAEVDMLTESLEQATVQQRVTVAAQRQLEVSIQKLEASQHVKDHEVSELKTTVILLESKLENADKAGGEKEQQLLGICSDMQLKLESAAETAAESKGQIDELDRQLASCQQEYQHARMEAKADADEREQLLLAKLAEMKAALEQAEWQCAEQGKYKENLEAAVVQLYAQAAQVDELHKQLQYTQQRCAERMQVQQAMAVERSELRSNLELADSQMTWLGQSVVHLNATAVQVQQGLDGLGLERRQLDNIISASWPESFLREPQQDATAVTHRQTDHNKDLGSIKRAAHRLLSKAGIGSV